MERGTDGRDYDWHYDYDHDGKLNGYERSIYEEQFTSDTNNYSRRQSPFTLLYSGCNIFITLLAYAIWIVGFLMMLVFPPLGALIIVGAVTLTEKCS